jgi:glucan biosynthesis protein C
VELDMSEDKKVKTVSRLAYLDNLRIYLTILVILHHAAIAYGGSGDWAIKDPEVDEISPIFLTFFNAVNQSYFMSAFFLLAGYFTPGSFTRKGARSFLVDRLIRLGIPLLVYSTLIIQMNQLILNVWGRGQRFEWVWGYNVGHLWFLQALLLFAVVYAALSGRTRGMLANRPDHPQQAATFPRNRSLVSTIGILTVLTFGVRIFFPVGVWTYGFQLAHFVHYVFSFIAGILAYRFGWFTGLGRRQARRWGAVALGILPLFFVLAVLGGALESEAQLARFLGGFHWQSLAYTLWESVLLISIMVFLLHTFREYFNQGGPCLRGMAASVYTVYIIHQTVLFVFNILFLDVAMASILKLILVSLIAVPSCFLLAGWIRRIPGAARVLG